jgi:hypothetical protein
VRYCIFTNPESFDQKGILGMPKILEMSEKIENLMKISDFHMSRFRDRQIMEWRVTFGFWAVLSASLIYIKNGLPFYGIFVLFLLFTLHASWIFAVNFRSFHEISRSYFYRDCAESILRSGRCDLDIAPKGWVASSPDQRKKIRHEVWRAPLVWFQVLVTGILSFLVFWLPHAGITTDVSAKKNGNITVIEVIGSR